jgi:uncharacterized membrane protein YvlD (DUF360 family)
MTYFLVRVVVNTLAVAIVMNVVPGLRLVPNSSLPEPFATSFAYISIGLIFGALHAVVRPAILFLTGRLYIWSMGLLALATDVFIFLLLSYLAPAVWQVGGSRLFSALLGAILLGVNLRSTSFARSCSRCSSMASSTPIRTRAMCGSTSRQVASSSSIWA